MLVQPSEEDLRLQATAPKSENNFERPESLTEKAVNNFAEELKAIAERVTALELLNKEKEKTITDEAHD